MRFTPELTTQSFCFPLPHDAFEALTNFEDLDAMRQIANPVALSTYLEAIDGFSDVEYNGHFGGNVFLSIANPDDGSAIEDHVQLADRIIGAFVDRALAVKRFLPEILELNDDYYENPVDLIYTDDSMVITNLSGNDDIVVAHAGGKTPIGSARFLLDLIQEHNHQIAQDNEFRVPRIPASNLPEVRNWVSSFVDIPNIKIMPAIAVDNHPLAKFLAAGSMPIWCDKDFIVCDVDNESTTLYFNDGISPGTKYFSDGARDQIREMVVEAHAIPGAGRKLSNFLQRQMGSDFRPSHPAQF